MDDLPVRKNIRLKNYNYSSNGIYFITLCVKDRHEMLGKIIVGSDDLGAPHVELSEYGRIADKYIEKIEINYDASVDKYIIMPNHVHLLIFVKTGVPGSSGGVPGSSGGVPGSSGGVPGSSGGVPGSSRPTMLIPNIIAALKKMINREIGFNLWQTSYHDHIIRSEEDYQNHWQYIDENPAKWAEDEYYNEKNIYFV